MGYQNGEKDPEAFRQKINVVNSQISTNSCTVVDWGSAEGAYSLEIAKKSSLRNVISVESNQQPTNQRKPTDIQSQHKTFFKLENMNIIETRIRENDILMQASKSGYLPQVDYQLLLNVLHHFNLSKIDWYKFVYSFLTLAGVSFICIPEKREANNKKTVNNHRIAEWYGQNNTPEQLIRDIVLFNSGEDPKIDSLIHHKSYYAGVDRMIFKVTLEHSYSIPNATFPRDFVSMLLRSEKEWTRVQNEGG